MRKFFNIATIILCLAIAPTIARSQNNTNAVSSGSTHGVFKCRYGTLDIIDAVAVFAVRDEYSKTYGLGVRFCYKPMTVDDVAFMKKAGYLAESRDRTIKVSGFPDGFAPGLSFGLVDLPIGQFPPKSGTNINSIGFRCGGRSMHANLTEVSKVQIAHYEIKPIDEGHFSVTGHFVGHYHFGDAGDKAGEDNWDWDITFEAKSINWNVAKFGVESRRSDESTKR
jgi:hypothetical protein